MASTDADLDLNPLELWVVEKVRDFARQDPDDMPFKVGFSNHGDQLTLTIMRDPPPLPPVHVSKKAKSHG
jgi:hypothetical protein